jgi:ribosomal-protein-alanine N-acetyltransferase
VAEILETVRTRLREFIDADADGIMRTFSDPAAMAFAPIPATQDRSVAEAAIAWHRQNYREHGHSAWAIVDRESGAFVGMAGLLPQETGIEIFFSLVPDTWGKGLATEVARACVGHAFHRLRMPRLIGMVHPEHVRAIRVLRAVGMADVGTVTYWNRLNRLFEIERSESDPARSIDANREKI